MFRIVLQALKVLGIKKTTMKSDQVNADAFYSFHRDYIPPGCLCNLIIF